MPSLGCLFLSLEILVRRVATILVGRNTTWAGVVETNTTSDLLTTGSPVVVGLVVDVVVEVVTDVVVVVVVDVVEVVEVVVVVVVVF